MKQVLVGGEEAVVEDVPDGRILLQDDYTSLRVPGDHSRWHARAAAKGHLAKFRAQATALTAGDSWPISLGEQVEATQTSFDVEERIHR